MRSPNVATPASDVLTSYPEADVRLEYEAEVALVEIIASTQRPARHVVGTRPPDLDALPLPRWDAIDLDLRDRFVRSVVLARAATDDS